MRCLIAVEPEISDNLKANLESIYPDIVFETCSHAEDLFALSGRNPDVLLLSRFLPGQNALKLLKELPLMFPTAHIVLLVGDLDEDCRAYLRAAKDCGLTNYVTGRLPGDRPYTLFVALKQERETGRSIAYGDEEDCRGGHVETHCEQPFSFPDERSSPPERRCECHFPPDPEPAGDEPLFVRGRAVQRGLLVLAAANKGGVGKTTAAVTLSIALANAGIDVVMLDLDLEGPNVCSFFGLKPERGIEALADRRRGLPYLIEQLLASTRYENLRVLPGLVDKTIHPQNALTRSQAAGIVDAARQVAGVVVVDTPPGFWAKPWLLDVFPMADLVLAVVDQSAFSQKDCEEYAPYLLRMGVVPEKIRIILNRFSPKLHNARVIERTFCAGFKKDVPAKKLPRIAATIPNDWDAHALKGYRGEAVGLDDARSQWHNLAEEVAILAGFRYRRPAKSKKKGASLRELLGLGGLIR